jgi:sodium transport system ATP-binding protein
MIIVSNLHKSFEVYGRTVVAVKDVSFTVREGEVYGLLGPNGAGKTTTMRMVLGLLRPDSGYAQIGEFRSDKSSDDIKRLVGFVSANAGVYQWLTGREALSFFGDVYGLAPDVVESRIDSVADLLDLHNFLDQRGSTLSTGQKQRINLARAIVHDPPIMLLDEPTLGLDVVGSQVVFEFIDLLKQKQKCVILCTHRLEQAERICDRFGLVHRGEMVAEGNLDELRAKTGKASLVEMFIDLIDLTKTIESAPR